MKQIYWIDDNFSEMFFILQGAISKLWKLDKKEIDKEERIRSVMIIFGDCSMKSEKLPSEEREIECELALRDFFTMYCFKLDGPNPNRPTFVTNNYLVENAVKYALIEENEDDVKLYRDIKDYWCDNDAQSEPLVEKQMTELVKKMGIEEKSVVGIDLSLLSGDVERIKKREKVISMQLYSFLNKSHKCFLYSAEAENIEFTDNWTEIYKNNYENLPIKIYKRKDFLKKGRSKIIKEIEELFEEKVEGDDDK